MVLLHYRVVPILNGRAERDRPALLAQQAASEPEPCRPPEKPQAGSGRAA